MRSGSQKGDVVPVYHTTLDIICEKVGRFPSHEIGLAALDLQAKSARDGSILPEVTKKPGPESRRLAPG
jgi:hypothetical protein